MRSPTALAEKVSAHSQKMRETGEDDFAALGLEPCPWIASKDLKKRFLELAAKWHPDAGGGSTERFQRIGVAYARLKDPALRIDTLVKATWPDAPAAKPAFPDQRIFGEIASALQQSRGLRTIPSGKGSALLLVLQIRKAGDFLPLLEGLVKKLAKARKPLEEELRNHSEDWRKRGAEYWKGMANRFRFLEKMEKELAEELFLLSEFAGGLKDARFK